MNDSAFFPPGGKAELVRMALPGAATLTFADFIVSPYPEVFDAWYAPLMEPLALADGVYAEVAAYCEARMVNIEGEILGNANLGVLLDHKDLSQDFIWAPLVSGTPIWDADAGDEQPWTPLYQIGSGGSSILATDEQTLTLAIASWNEPTGGAVEVRNCQIIFQRGIVL